MNNNHDIPAVMTSQLKNHTNVHKRQSGRLRAQSESSCRVLIKLLCQELSGSGLSASVKQDKAALPSLGHKACRSRV